MRRFIVILGTVCVSLGIAGLAIVLYSNTDGGPGLRRQDPPIPKPPMTAIDPPNVEFRNITKEAGITFVHTHGGFGQKLLPETMGSGVLVFDFNQDGYQDLLFVNSSRWPHHKYEGAAPPARLALYQNDGTGKFKDVTEAQGLGGIECYGMGVAAGDIDNDDFPDVIITALGRCFLLHNEQGKGFKDITESAGLKCSGWSTSAAFLDYDLDGKLDLFICHYVKWTPETDLLCKLIGNEKSYCTPVLYEGEHCQLFHNLGGNKFEDVSKAAGLHLLDVLEQKPSSKALGVAVHDYNDDGWPDIAVANDTTPNFLLENQRDGTFKNVGSRKGVELLNESTRGTARGAMGICWGYYRDGETLSLAIANFSNEPNGLLRYARRSDIFTDVAYADGVGGPSRLLLKFALFFFDYDLDGRLDLFTSNGHIEPEIGRVQAEVKYAQPAQLFWNAGRTEHGCFREVEKQHAGPDLFAPRVGRGGAYGDLDGDGDLDIALNNNNQPATVLRNECPSTTNAIRLKLRGVEANRMGLGSRVKVYVDRVLQQAELNSGSSYLSQSEAVLTFGMGNTDMADLVEIRWPTKDGKLTHLKHLRAGFTYLVDENEGVVSKTPFRREGE